MLLQNQAALQLGKNCLPWPLALKVGGGLNGARSTGRLVLAKKLRDKIGITDEAVFVASGDTFQIWEPAAYAEHSASLEDWIEDEADEDFDPLTLLDDDTAGG